LFFGCTRPCHPERREAKPNCSAVPNEVKAGSRAGARTFVDPALRTPSLGRVRLRKHPTGIFSPLRMTQGGFCQFVESEKLDSFACEGGIVCLLTKFGGCDKILKMM
ncbi:MAG: hypothetical protein IJD35_08105, partial [Clostridia bacterium]|nr:hypothetical protein [Clostridia bacterium]